MFEILILMGIYAVIHAGFAIYRGRKERAQAQKDWERFEEEAKQLPKKD